MFTAALSGQRQPCVDEFSGAVVGVFLLVILAYQLGFHTVSWLDGFLAATAGSVVLLAVLGLFKKKA